MFTLQHKMIVNTNHLCTSVYPDILFGTETQQGTTKTPSITLQDCSESLYGSQRQKQSRTNEMKELKSTKYKVTDVLCILMKGMQNLVQNVLCKIAKQRFFLILLMQNLTWHLQNFVCVQTVVFSKFAKV